MFFSISGLVLSKYYCGGVFKNVVLFGEVVFCYENNVMEVCLFYSSMKMLEDDILEDSSCCDMKSELFKVDIEMVEIIVDFSFMDYLVLLVVLFVFSGVSLVESDSKIIYYFFYKFFFLVCDFLVRF